MENKFKPYKDQNKLQQIGLDCIRKNLIEIAEKMKKESDWKAWLLPKCKEGSEQHPDRSECKWTEKKGQVEKEDRMCRCIYFCNNGYEKCKHCKYKSPYYLTNSNIKIIDYQRTTKRKITGVGKVDICFKYKNNKYAVEVKPYKNENKKRYGEPLPRMIAEILTYCLDENMAGYKPAIMFPNKDAKIDDQYFQYKKLKNIPAMAYIRKKIKFFKYTRIKNDKEKGYKITIDEV